MGKNRTKKTKRIRKKPKAKKGLSLFPLLLVLTLGIIASNFLLQIAKKPAEVLAISNISTKKTPRQTWHSYGYYFVEHSTQTLPPEFLAALAQTESGGDPFATPEWRMDTRAGLLDIFSPASSSVGLMQFTSGTYRQAQEFCIHHNEVQTTGPWHKINSCWFNALYLRTSASDSIEMASAFLTHKVNNIVKGVHVSKKVLLKLAAITHLCGENVSQRLFKRGFKGLSKKTCGSHSVKNYLRKIQKYQRVFKQLGSHS